MKHLNNDMKFQKNDNNTSVNQFDVSITPFLVQHCDCLSTFTPAAATLSCFTPARLSPSHCDCLHRRHRHASSSSVSITQQQQPQRLLLWFTYFIILWIKTGPEGGCRCVLGWDGEPAVEPGRHPPGGDLGVLPAALREWGPVQEGKSAPFGPVRETLRN